ncbi:MAG: multifunctional CCA tRNA nucleotidyl transferase/2'3'-cyclic phosphodiesterase/2'nucleotidase/phosphatase [Gammaproteobacteria bacterium]|nr:MAG: multifunctional CCA tRNA nucleotidyl transferase/2'3'-cyclic phosphodiesterase/2'nucleotidase/phosphatase [Gammaproteobacteria bacterium]
MTESVVPPSPARTYLVGGAVRDCLLGLPVHERDWVVVGSTPEAMRAAGFRQADPEFPVFRHPRTGEEYALARRETKVGEGYRGFRVDAGPEVSLEEDLARRDLTINAMAEDEQGRLIDPYGGEEDLRQGLLRHVTPAFAEDPVRLLRIARFAARFGGYGFRVAHGTHRLMKAMVRQGAVAELRPERIWRELHKALGYPQPWRFFEVLHACGALAELMPGLDRLMTSGHGGADVAAVPIQALQRISQKAATPEARLAALLLQTPDALETISRRLGIPRKALEPARLARELWPRVRDLHRLDAVQREDLLERMHAWRRDGRFDALLAVFAAQPNAPAGVADLARAREAGLGVDVEALQAQGYQGAALGQALKAARVAAIAGAGGG